MGPFETLKKGLEVMGIDADGEMIGKFKTMTDFMLEYNKKVNLTRITEPKDVIRLHYLDSASMLDHTEVKMGASIIDVGTGAGFPGLVLKILRPDISLCLLDGSRKRIDYLKALCKKLEIHNVDFVHGRGEEVSHDEKYREKFDFAVSRAVAQLSKLCELCIPYVKVGGMFISYKGSDAEAELEMSKSAVTKLGGAEAKLHPAPIYDSETRHALVIIKKINQTDRQYPRKNARIQKNPL